MKPKRRKSIDLSDDTFNAIARTAFNCGKSFKWYIEQHLEEWAKELEKKK